MSFQVVTHKDGKEKEVYNGRNETKAEMLAVETEGFIRVWAGRMIGYLNPDGYSEVGKSW